MANKRSGYGNYSSDLWDFYCLIFVFVTCHHKKKISASEILVRTGTRAIPLCPRHTSCWSVFPVFSSLQHMHLLSSGKWFTWMTSRSKKGQKAMLSMIIEIILFLQRTSWGKYTSYREFDCETSLFNCKNWPLPAFCQCLLNVLLKKIKN